MIPSFDSLLSQELNISAQPSKTYAMRFNELSVNGNKDELEAVKQAVFKILQTERYRYIMYSNNYGIELCDLFGEPVSYVCPELERRITEALLWDDRIESVSDFNFSFPEKGTVFVTFNVQSVFGSFEAEKEVNF